MKTKFLFLLVACQFTLYISCIRSFVPQLDKYEELVVVDGGISDAPGPYTVKLSKSVILQERSKYIPYSHCNVSIEDELGNKAILSEASAGTYLTDSLAIQGVIGRSYRLIISTPDGETYESTQDVLPSPLGIQSLYGELVHKNDPALFYGRDGLQFYLDAETPVNRDVFLLWNVQCTYKFKTDFKIQSYYDQGKLNPVVNQDTLQTCYRTMDILNLFTFSTKDFTQSQITRVPLHYEDNYTKALSIRYSLKVTQFTINETAYNYWNTIKKLRDAGGELFTQQPYQVKNNLINLTNPERPALGYFTVAGHAEKRIFINRPAIVNRYDVCSLSLPTKYLTDKIKRRPDLWPFFLIDTLEYKGFYWIDQECVDCRVKGTIIRPSFWVD